MKIDKKKFIENFLDKDSSKAKIAALQESAEDVIEFSVGKKFFYSLPQSNDLKIIHERIRKTFLDLVELNNSAIAFRAGLSYFDFLEPHQNNYNFLRLDISSFFHSINIEYVKSAFSVYFKDESLFDDEEEKLIDLFLSWVSFLVPKDSQNTKFSGMKIIPIGFSTSPVISNIIFRVVDIKIQEFCKSKNIVYTRYADDMLFSSGEESDFLHSITFEKEISILLSILDLKINHRKTIRSLHTISINGYTVQGRPNRKSWIGYQGWVGVRISNKKTKIIEDIIYSFKKGNAPLDIMASKFKFKIKSQYDDRPISRKKMEQYAKSQLFNKMAGYRSYLISAIKFSHKTNCFSSESLKKYSRIIGDLERCLDKLASAS